MLTPAIAFGDAAADDFAAGCVRAIRGQMAALPDGPVLLNSYLVETGAADFDLTQAAAAYVYDNALAGLLLLAAGDKDGARRIGAALEIAQGHDPFYNDGRLRNAYMAGAVAAPAKLPGWWDAQAGRWAEDPYQIGSESGPMAWAMLLWAALGMRAPADAAGDFLDDQLRADAGYYGGFYGFEPKPLKLTWQSTEQNTDLYAAFSRLGRAEDAAQAKKFVTAMWDAGSGRFDAGTAPDGAVNHLGAADAGIWPYLAGLGTAESALTAIKALRRGAGIGFSDASASIWLEGTAFAALALRQMRDPLAAIFFAALAQNLSPQGYVYATVAPELATGLTTGPSLQKGVPEQAFNYFRRPALSTTAWAGLAAMGINPLG
ncbi:hypothetical protein [Acidocella aquatica]|nr:hypothetical protein [Acidocella aquatica]